ncbi:MAG: RNA polymerase sigma factor, partial [Planctomycetia bacterium]
MASLQPRPAPAAGLAPDDALMVRCGQGDVAALEALVARHQDAASRHCWRVVRNHHTAEDGVQDFVVKLF